MKSARNLSAADDQPGISEKQPRFALLSFRALTIRQISMIVGICYFLISFFVFRHVIANIPLVLSGQAVINGDELVPFFNPNSQLIDQAAGKFNQLTNGYEFRVRYSILTTWFRYYKVLPFAIVLVIPTITYLAYLATASLLRAEGVAVGPGQGNGPPRRDALQGAGVGVVGAGPAVLVPAAADEPRGLGQLMVAFGDAKQDLVEGGRARQVELPLSGSHAVEVQVRVDQARQDHGAFEIDRVAPGGTFPDRGHHAALEADGGGVRP